MPGTQPRSQPQPQPQPRLIDVRDLALAGRAAEPLLTVPAGADVATPWLTGCHVLLVSIDHDPDGIGVPSHCVPVAEHLATSAQTVTVLSGVAHRPTRNPLVAARRLRRDRAAAAPGRPRIVRVDYSLPPGQTPIVRAAYETSRLASAAVAALPARPHLVLASTPSLGGAVAAARVARKFGAPLVVLAYDLVAVSPDAAPSGGALERQALGAADLVAIMNEDLRSLVAGYGVAAHRIHLVRSWVQSDRSPLTRREARAELGWPARPVVALHAGPSSRKQDLPTVLAAANLLGDRRELRMVVSVDPAPGQPPEPTRVAPRTYPLALAAADILVVAEKDGVRDPATGQLLATCLAAGRPVIAAVPPGSSAAVAVERSGAGLVVRPGDAAALAEAIRTLARDGGRREEMAVAALRHARSAMAYRASMRALDGVVELALAHRW